MKTEAEPLCSVYKTSTTEFSKILVSPKIKLQHVTRKKKKKKKATTFYMAQKVILFLFYMAQKVILFLYKIIMISVILLIPMTGIANMNFKFLSLTQLH